MNIYVKNDSTHDWGEKIQTYQNDRKAILFLGVQIPDFYAFHILSKIDDLWIVSHIFGHQVA